MPGEAPDRGPGKPLDDTVFGRLAALEAEMPGFLAELVEEFQKGVVRRLAAMNEALATDDPDGLSFAAHSMRGSCGTVGALRMAALSARLEEAVVDGGESRRLVRCLEEEYDAVRAALALALALAQGTGTVSGS
jgi:HPt (histidine-containing phosphotransfer) domain-containing protein